MSISGFGHTGPDAKRPGFGKIAEGLSGLVPLTGRPADVPLHVGFSLADTSAGLLGCMAINMALLDRDRNGGRGARIDVGLYEPLLRMTELQAALQEQAGVPPRRTGSNDPYCWGAEPDWGASNGDGRRFVAASCRDGDELLVLINPPSADAVADLSGCRWSPSRRADAACGLGSSADRGRRPAAAAAASKRPESTMGPVSRRPPTFAPRRRREATVPGAGTLDVPAGSRCAPLHGNGDTEANPFTLPGREHDTRSLRPVYHSGLGRRGRRSPDSHADASVCAPSRPAPATGGHRARILGAASSLPGPRRTRPRRLAGATGACQRSLRRLPSRLLVRKDDWPAAAKLQPTPRP